MITSDKFRDYLHRRRLLPRTALLTVPQMVAVMEEILRQVEDKVYLEVNDIDITLKKDRLIVLHKEEEHVYQWTESYEEQIDILLGAINFILGCGLRDYVTPDVVENPDSDLYNYLHVYSDTEEE